MDSMFDDLIPAPQDGELSFDDLIPNPGALRPPSALDALPTTEAQLAPWDRAITPQGEAARVATPANFAQPTETDIWSGAAVTPQPGPAFGALNPIAEAFGVPGGQPRGSSGVEASLEPAFETAASASGPRLNFSPAPGSGLAGALSSYGALLGLQSPRPEAGESSDQVDWSYIGRHEAPGGVPMLSLYVPTSDGAATDGSGATVGLGVDLHGRTAASLVALGIDPALADELAAYAPFRGADALSYVRQHPLTLTKPQVEQLDSAVQRHDLASLAERFDAASSVGAFARLPPNTQTAIADLYFQYGVTNPAGAAPNFWRQVTTGDWRGAYGDLMDFGDKYRSRRRSEAALLLKDLDAGQLSR